MRWKGPLRQLRGAKNVVVDPPKVLGAPFSECGYLLATLDAPSFSAPIYATLVQAEGDEGMQLIWSRPNGNRD